MCWKRVTLHLLRTWCFLTRLWFGDMMFSLCLQMSLPKLFCVFHSTYYLHFRVKAETRWGCVLVARGPFWSLRPDHNDRGIEAESHWRHYNRLCERGRGVTMSSWHYNGPLIEDPITRIQPCGDVPKKPRWLCIKCCSPSSVCSLDNCLLRGGSRRTHSCAPSEILTRHLQILATILSIEQPQFVC